MAKKQPSSTKKKSSVRHTRAIQCDRTKRSLAAPPAEQVEHRLQEVVLPAVEAHQGRYRQLGLRCRTLTLPVMVAVVLALIWRQIGSGPTEIARLLRTEGLLWVGVLQVSQQALSERLGTLPATLLLSLLNAVLPVFQTRWQARQRPLPPEIAWAVTQYTQVWAVDGSTLDALVRKVGLLRGALTYPLAGKMTAVLDLASRLPRAVWYTPQATANDQAFWPQIRRFVPAGALLIFDLGYLNFLMFAHLTLAQVRFITRARCNLAYQVNRYLVRTAQVHDLLIWVGTGERRQCLRLVAVLYRGQWYRFLTNELDPHRLPWQYVVRLYYQRWRIEETYEVVKRLLGLAYLWTGAPNGVELQLWGTWLLYGVLVDLTDAVAATLNRPFAALSMEMVFRSLYYFAQAVQRHEATDLVAYLAANAKWLGLLKRHRKRSTLPLPETLPLTAEADP